MTYDSTTVAACLVDYLMDDGSNSTNGSLDLEAPKAEMLDYAEIILLTCMVMVGGPLNVVCFCRSSGPYFRADTSAPAGPQQRQNGRRRNSNWKASGPYSSRSVSLRVHLTAANLLIIWIYGISQICWLFTYSWLAGDIMCRLVKFFHTFCFYSTSNIIVMIAIDRLYVTGHIDRPPRSPTRSNERRLRFAVCWIPWILAFISSAPQLFVWNVIAPYKDKLPNWYQCVNMWVTWKVQHLERADELSEQFELATLQEMIYSLSHLILVFWCPAFVVVCSYAVIVGRFRRKIIQTQLDTRRSQQSANVEGFRARAAKLHYRLRVPNGSASSPTRSRADSAKSGSFRVGRLTEVPIIIAAPQIFNSSGAVSSNVTIQTLSRVKRRTVLTSACISFAYVACWSPYNILEMWRFLDPTLDNRYLELLSNLIVLNAVVNPLIYDTHLSLRQ